MRDARTGARKIQSEALNGVAVVLTALKSLKCRASTLTSARLFRDQPILRRR